MKPIVTTIAMAFVALATSVAAWYFYPRIETREEVVREQLLTEEEAFLPGDVRRVTIQQFDRDSNSPVEFEFRMESGSWVLPRHGNYPANNAERVAAAIRVMNDKEVLEVVSDNKDDHEEYGVLDLTEVGATGLGAGTVLEFEGTNRKRLGKMIVGRSPEGNDSQRYVRLAGQPQIYIIDFDPSVLTTQFPDWVDGRLVNVGNEQVSLPDLIQEINVDLYFRDQDGTNKTSYRARIRPTEDNRWLYDLWQPDAENNIAAEPTMADQQVNLQTLRRLVEQLMAFEIRDVDKKQETPAQDLAEPDADQPASHFESLTSRGFYHAGFDKGQHQFDAAAGEITISLRFGMEIRLYMGSMYVMGVSGAGEIDRYLMLTANVNADLVPQPEKTTADDEATSDDADAGDATTEEDSAEATQDEAERQYQTALRRRNELLDLAAKQSRSFNQIHADWIYVIPDEAISRLFPSADEWKSPE